MASIKSELTTLGKELFWDNFVKITKKNNSYCVYILPHWDEEIVFQIKQWRLDSWGANEQEQLDIASDFARIWKLFEKDACIINPDFANGFDDSDRGFVPNNYLNYRLKK